MTDTKTSVGRPAKKDLSYIKLVFFDEVSDVDSECSGMRVTF